MPKIKTIKISQYELTLSPDEMTELWCIMSDLHNGIKPKQLVTRKWYDILEDVRPGGGFEQREYID